MKIKPLYTPSPERPMAVAAFMSGSGTNLVKILEHEKKLLKVNGEKPFEVTLIFTDNKNSNGQKIAEENGIKLIVNDILDYYKSHGKKDKKDLSLRPGFDAISINMLSQYNFDVIALAGYMSILTTELLTTYEGKFFNVHPADLTCKEGEKRRYTGDKAVAKAIKYGEKSIYATTHLVGEEVDYGQVLIISPPVKVILPADVTIEMLQVPENIKLLNSIAEKNQDRLKEQGDWVAFPKTLEMIAKGRFGIDEKGAVYLDNKPIPNGYRL